MTLESTYEEFKGLNSEYISFIEELLESNFTNYSEEEIVEKLANGKIVFETLKVKSDNIEIEDKDKENLMDLKYLIIDGLFLAIDLLNFYKLKEMERFKMRIVNYVRKKRVTERM
ncbi:hypothetical protein ACQPU1_06850 [Clostridium paraputrificum]|uniref:hypothetical protein n=1 Tax=Clostridium paraputrificum TaxID=29363 RepID=UPI003D332E80